MKGEPKLLSFSSPKGGVGRTMTAANIAVLYSTGCSWAKLVPRKTLLIDMDFEAPGIHYYDFAQPLKAVLKLNRCRYRTRGEMFESHSSLIRWIRTQRDFGLLFWLSSVVQNQKLDKVISEFRGARRGKVIPSHILISDVRKTLFSSIDGAPKGDILDPSQHVIEVLDDNDLPLMYLLPPGDPNQVSYEPALKQFTWNQFFEERAGFAVLSTLYSWFLREGPNGSFVVERILLDQDAGDSWPSEANRRVAHNRILVTGLNLQNQEGLLNLFGKSEVPIDFADVRVVLSQYKGRPMEPLDRSEPVSGAAVHPLISRQAFLEAENQRKSTMNLLTKKKGVNPNNIFLVDFLVKAVQLEYFHEIASPSWNELVRLIVSIESSFVEDLQQPKTPNFAELRILGEFVGVDDSNPSGPIDALRTWLSEQLPDLTISGIATGHEQIVTLARTGVVDLCGSKDVFFKSQLHVMKRANDNEATAFEFNDFDLIALPVYMVPHVFDRLERLTLDGFEIHTSDRVGAIDVGYLRESILGFEEYALYKGASFIGFPLFVDFQLLVVNKDRVMESFDYQYFREEQRRFRGFQDPADVLAAARAVKKDTIPRNRIIMTLKKHISQWYEWQTVVSLFGGIDFVVSDAWEDISNEQVIKLTSEETIRATRFYLELCSYAAHDSDSADWDKAIKLFYEKKTAGMAFMFPDAIPREYRWLNAGEPFVYATPPCELHPEECWLVVIPKARREGAPATGYLQDLLAKFATFESQKRFQELGGMTTHRRALECVDLWYSSPYLAHLLSLSMNRRNSVFLRTASCKSRTAAEKIVDALDRLRNFVEIELKHEAEGSSSSDFLWYKEAFIQRVESEIKKHFSPIVKSLVEES